MKKPSILPLPMLMLCISILSMHTVVSCQSNDSLKPYITEFYDHLERVCPETHDLRNERYSIGFGDTDSDGTIGYCAPLLNGYQIVIDKDFWNRASLEDRSNLMYHELTHCVLGVQHSSDEKNYMYPVIHHMTFNEVYSQADKYMKDYCNDRGLFNE